MSENSQPAVTPFRDPPQSPLEDAALAEYRDFLLERSHRHETELARINGQYGSLYEYADLHKQLGPHRSLDSNGQPCWRWREYMPAAGDVWLTTEKLGFRRLGEYRFRRLGSTHGLGGNPGGNVQAAGDGFLELVLPIDALQEGDYLELRLQPSSAIQTNSPAWQGAPAQRRVPAFATWVEQDKADPNQWCARFRDPDKPYAFKNPRPPRQVFPRIYESHIGMAQPAIGHTVDSIGSYAMFAQNILPRIRAAGYTAIQLMGVVEHPLYRSFGYQVSSYFAPSHRYGTPEEFCQLVDAAHGLGLAVILDITHAHSCSNTEQGLAAYDGSQYFFNAKYNQWGTPSFDYSQEMTRRFLLSNCRYWLEDFCIDGFRFDAVGNMLYLDHGVDDDFSHVGRCFFGKDGAPRTDACGELYLGLANALVHEIVPQAMTIAEEFSGMPGLTCLPGQGGLGFDFRFAMGIPDYWEKCIKAPRDMGSLWYEMTNHRPYDRTVSYVECHDQCINGDDAMIWRLIGDAMYRCMDREHDEWNVSRGLAFYRLMRLITLAAADAGYLNFMGNEFGHPEWLDADEHAHRQWHLADDPGLRYSGLAAYDRALLLDMVAAHAESFAVPPMFRYIHEDKRLLAFERGRLLLVFNFHETEAHADILFAVSPGKYVELLSSDEKRFAGHGNLEMTDPPLEHFSKQLAWRYEQDVSLYLPPMSALVLVRED